MKTLLLQFEVPDFQILKHVNNVNHMNNLTVINMATLIVRLILHLFKTRTRRNTARPDERVVCVGDQ